MGFNYVFPTSGKQMFAELPYFSVLANAFRLINPVYIHEFYDIHECERYLNSVYDYDYL